MIFISSWDSKKCEIGESVLWSHLKIQKELISLSYSKLELKIKKYSYNKIWD